MATRAARATANAEVSQATRTVYEISTLETLRYAKQNNGKGYFTFCTPLYAVHKVNETLNIKVYSEIHCDFVAKNLQNNFVIRAIQQDENFNNLTTDSKWKKITSVDFFRKDGSKIESPILDLDNFEEVEI